MHRHGPTLAVASIALAGLLACASGAPRTDPDASALLDLGRQLSVEEQSRHVLNRLAFGPRPGEVERVQRQGVDRWIAEQLSSANIDDRTMDQQLKSYPILGRRAADLMREFPRPSALLARERLRRDSLVSAADSSALRSSAVQSRRFIGQLMSARVARAVGSERQLQEVMTDFWLNHFSVFVGKGELRDYLPEYERDAIRPHALGTFRELLGAVAHSPAMLYYLDNARSVADSGSPTLASRRGDSGRRRLVQSAMDRRRATMTDDQRQRLEELQARRPKGLNENYARELLELHTLGVDGGYTQRDIIEVARALTGWTVRPARVGAPEFWFNGAAHDAGPKDVLGARLRAGRGIDDGEQVLDLLAHHPSTARFIAGKLVVRLVSDSPPKSLVERAAETFRRTDGDLREVVRTIVTSPEFFSRSAYRSKVKSPFEVAASAARAIGARPDTTVVSSLLVARLGQPIYGHQAPNGWPETGDAWMNTGAILSRINFGLAVAANGVPGARLTEWSGYRQLRSAPRPVQVDGVIDAFLGGSASAETREILARGEHPFLLQLSDSLRASSDLAVPRDEVPSVGAGPPPRVNGGMRAPDPLYQSNPNRRVALRGLDAPTSSRLAGLDQIVGLALGSPEFQRR